MLQTAIKFLDQNRQVLGLNSNSKFSCSAGQAFLFLNWLSFSSEDKAGPRLLQCLGSMLALLACKTISLTECLGQSPARWKLPQGCVLSCFTANDRIHFQFTVQCLKMRLTQPQKHSWILTSWPIYCPQMFLKTKRVDSRRNRFDEAE